MVLRIDGDIVSADMKPVYDWFGLESTSPADVLAALEALPEGDRLQVRINSSGGDALAGSEIYSVLRGRDDVDIDVESLAASAASIIAMAGPSTISPTGMIMVHNVSAAQAAGDKHEMRKLSDVLQKWDEALAGAYAEKTGLSMEEVLKLMDRETWLTAGRAVELGFIDSVSGAAPAFGNSIGGMKVTAEMVERYAAHKAEEERNAALKAEILCDLDKFGGKGA